jgi:hypothetical protein
MKASFLLLVMLSCGACSLLRSKLIYTYSQEIDAQITKSTTALYQSYGEEYPKRNIFIFATNSRGNTHLTLTLYKKLPTCVKKIIASSNRYVRVGEFGNVPIVFDHDHQSTLFKGCGITMIPHGGRTIVFDDDLKIIYAE